MCWTQQRRPGSEGGGHDVSGVSQMDHRLECMGASGKLQSVCQDACVLWFREPIPTVVSVVPLVPKFTGFSEGIAHTISLRSTD